MQLIDEVIRYRESTKERRQLADALFLKGRVLELRGNPQDAWELYEKSLRLFERIGCTPSVSDKARCAVGRTGLVSPAHVTD